MMSDSRLEPADEDDLSLCHSQLAITSASLREDGGRICEAGAAMLTDDAGPAAHH